jgi:hypothetical protein
LFREAELGNAALARQNARVAVATFDDFNTRVAAAVTMAVAGDSTGAQNQADGLNKEWPLHTVIQSYWLPAIRAQLEINKGNPRHALEILESAADYELGWDGTRVQVALMYPVYVRGKAYLATGQGAAAAAEFQRILDHRGLVGNNLTGALARLYLGRARALEARSLQGVAAEDARTKARAAYQDFFTLWKNADPDIPILKAAQAEYARLQ